MQSLQDIDAVISQLSLGSVFVSVLLLSFLAVVSLVLKHPAAYVKRLLFLGIAATTITVTVFLTGATVFLNATSSSKGPVHWHADIEIWACGKELHLKDPKGMSNKIGTAVLHEHNDKRIHVEGVVVTPEDASLGKFFTVIGGSLSSDGMTVPTNENLLTYRTGGSCPNNVTGELQVFVYTVANNIYSQKKLTNPEQYIMSPVSSVPNGDCVIVEFDKYQERTNKVCQSYQVAERLGKIKGENNGN